MFFINMRLFFVRRERRYKYEVNSQTIKMREIQVLFYIRKSKDKWNLPVKIVSCLLQNLSFNISCSRTKLFLSVWIFVVTCCSKHFSNNPPRRQKIWCSREKFVYFFWPMRSLGSVTSGRFCASSKLFAISSSKTFAFCQKSHVWNCFKAKKILAK